MNDIPHILKLTNIEYNNKFIIKNPPENINLFIDKFSKESEVNDNKKIMIDNLLVVDTLHSCFSHAIIDSAFPFFWSINDIKENESSDNPKNFQLFITKEKIIKFKKQNLRKIDSDLKKYKGVWHDIITLVSDNYIFEHLIDNNTTYFIKNCYFYIRNDKWQRSPWNCKEYYPRRKRMSLKDTIFNDDILYYNLKKFVNNVKKKYSIFTQINESKKQVIIIEREKNRNFDKLILDKIINIIEENNLLQFNGVKILEKLPFNQQIKLFSENNIFIFRHGSCLTNLLWVPNHSTIIDLDIQLTMHKGIVERIAKVTDSKVIKLNYNDIDYSKFEDLK